MDELRVVLDTDFINRITSYEDGDPQGLFCRIFHTLRKKPVVHQYVAEHELTHNSVAKALMQSRFLEVIPYSAFLKDKLAWKRYDKNVRDMHNKLLGFRIDMGKSVFAELRPEDDITARHAQMSLGEIHSIFMAVELGIPLFYSNDADAKVVASRYPRGRLKVLNLEAVSEQLDVDNSEVTTKERKYLRNYNQHRR